MGFKRKLLWLILLLMPLLFLTGCGDLEPDMKDTRTVILNMDFHNRSSSRSSLSVSPSEYYNTHLILAVDYLEDLNPSYNNIHRDAEGLLDTTDTTNMKVSLKIPINKKMKIFAFLFRDEHPMSYLISDTRTVGDYGDSPVFDIDKQTTNLPLVITLKSTGTDNTAPTANVTTAAITTSGSVLVQSTETGTAYLVNSTVTVSNLASITGADNNTWNSVSISSPNNYTYLTATGLVDGTYNVYAVDGRRQPLHRL